MVESPPSNKLPVEPAESTPSTIEANVSSPIDDSINQFLGHPTTIKSVAIYEKSVDNDYQLGQQKNKNERYHLETIRKRSMWGVAILILTLILMFGFMLLALFYGGSAAWGGVAISPLLIFILPKIIETILKSKQ